MHFLAYLLAKSNPTINPEQMTILDIGSDANLVYLLIAVHA
ncbi:RlmF-related methyltransferase [Methylobacillus gramineus]|nr:RlmF-related methyltransferase [Methylobacillus gramineus]